MSYIKLPGIDIEMSDSLVTQKLYQKVMGVNPSYFKGCDNPVETVSWNDANEFISKLNAKITKFTYRLPTEKEWELCAKSCDKQDIKDIAWCWENSESKTHPVKLKLPNELGFYDMLGNAWEWCEDIEAGSCRVIRGGSWSNDAQYLRAGGRGSWGPENRYSYVGFRLVRTRRIPLHSSFCSLNSAALTLAIAKVQIALDELKMICGSSMMASKENE